MKDLLGFLDESPTAFQTVKNIREELLNRGYEELSESEEFRLKKGGKYFLTRNASSVMAFNVGKRLKNASFMISASHSDCPGFKIKPEAFLFDNGYLKLNTEVYGGAILYPWLDRPLSLAGRVFVSDKKGIKMTDFKDDEPFCIIPSLAIHMNREVNKNLSLNPQIDMLPICALSETDFKAVLGAKLKVNKEDIKGYDLYLYPLVKAYKWGLNEVFISAYHLDDLSSAYCCLEGFLDNFNDDNVNVYCCFDNEETGSLSRQGADSDFLYSSLRRIAEALNLDYYALVSGGMMLSCDNGHALHPNHPEKSDPKNRPYLNKGLVIKYNANQSYTSDGLSGALFKDLLDRNEVPYQHFANRSDERGGSTLGNISNSHVSLLSLDIGLPQLAMHSPMETMGSKDCEYMIKAVSLFYGSHLRRNEGYNILEV